MKDLDATQGYGSPQSPATPSPTSTSPEGRPFSQFLKDSIEEVNALQHEADRAIEQLASGQSKNLHETMILLEKADISFKLMMQVRNKIVEAYNEIMRMPV